MASASFFCSSLPLQHLSSSSSSSSHNAALPFPSPSSSSSSCSALCRAITKPKNVCTLSLRKRPVVCCQQQQQQQQLKKLSEIEPLFLGDGGQASGISSLPASPGVYAVYDKVGELQFVGISRKVSASIQAHAQDLPDLVGSVKINIVNSPDRNALTEAWKVWMEEHLESSGKVPPGNAQGDTTWTKRKRPTKSDLKLTPGQHVQLTVSLQELIDKVVKEFKVVAFIKGSRTSPQCGFSHRVLMVLNQQGVDYETVNVLDEEHNPGVREAIKMYSQWPTIPQVYIKGEFIGGADVLDEMVQSGEIQKVLLA